MDALKELVSEIFWLEGYSVRTSVEVELTKEENRLIGGHSLPCWELDIVAYHGRENLLRVVECKSYFDSAGVKASSFDGTSLNDAERFKLFNEPELRRIVFNRLCLDLATPGAGREMPQVRLALACDKVRNEDRAAIRAHFDRQGWELWDESWLRSLGDDVRRREKTNMKSS
jgi:hypothetical protein